VVEGSRYVDVGVFVYWLGGHPVYGERSYEWIRRIEAATPREYLTSSLTVYEALAVLAGLTGRKLSDQEFVQDVVEAFTRLRGLRIVPLRGEDITRAVQLMAEDQVDS